MAVVETWYVQDLNTPVRVNYLQGNIFSADNYGSIVGIECYRAGQPASLSGSVAATVVRPDGATVGIIGTLSGNRASVAIPYAACSVPGVISINIKLTSGSTVTTLGLVVANVYKTSTDTAVDPGTIIPSVTALIAQIEATVATIPADYSSLWTSLAPAYSTSKSYAIGDFCTYNGNLYRCGVAIPSGESWTSSHWSNVDVGDEISGIDNALSYKVNTRYGGATSSAYLGLTAGSTWNANSGTIQGNAPKRARTEQIQFTPDMQNLTLKNGYTAYVWGNNAGVGSTFNVISDWSASVNLNNVQYRYIYIAVHRTDDGDITSDNLSDVLTMTRATEVIPYLTKFDAVAPYGTRVTTSNYATILPDCNGATSCAVYNLFGCADVVQNTPYGGSQSKSATLVVFNGEASSTNFTAQLYATKDDGGSSLFARYAINNMFYAWKSLSSTSNVYADEMQYFVATCINKAEIGVDSSSKILAFGDSIVRGVGVDKAWLGYVADATGCTVVNKSIGGALFGQSVKTSYYWISTQIDGTTSAEWSGTTLVIVGAGTNDAGNDTPASELKEKVQAAITAIRAHTSAPILFITPIRRGASSTDADLLKLPLVSGIICNAAVANQCSVLNGFDIPIPTYTSGQIADLTQDHLHPNETGTRVYAMAFMGAVL